MINETNRLKPGDLVAVGDLHGRFDILEPLVEGLRNTHINLLFLGDLIDRAANPGDDLRILDLVKQMRENPKEWGLFDVDVLRGNHEDMFLNAVKERERGFHNGWNSDIALWQRNGGDVENLEAMKHHAEWLQDVPLYKLVDDTLFVHAGVAPDVPLDQQRNHDLIWIRDPFLNAEYINVPGVRRVVHGHTPNFYGNPVVTRERICIDTAAYRTGVLTLYNNRSGELMRLHLDEATYTEGG